jgi:UDP-glucose 4-epimerase
MGVNVTTNALGTVNVVRAAQATGVLWLLYFQTALCYGTTPTEQPVTLDHPIRPDSSYASPDRRRAVHRAGRPGLRLVPARQRVRPRNISGPLPTFCHRLTEQGVFVMDRRALRLIDDLVDVDAGRGWHRPRLPHLSAPTFDRTVRRDDAALPEVELEEDVGSGPRAGRRVRSSSTPRIQPTSAGRRNAARRGRRRAIDYYREYGVSQTYHISSGSSFADRRILSPGGAAHRANLVRHCWKAIRARSGGGQPALDRAREPAGRRPRAPGRGHRSATTTCWRPSRTSTASSLSAYHGNQSSMADPLADHEHNTLTSPAHEALKFGG